MDHFTHSKVLELKDLFEKHRGSAEVKINFKHGGDLIGSLQIQDPWGVEATQSLQDKVKKVSGVDAISAK